MKLSPVCKIPLLVWRKLVAVIVVVGVIGIVVGWVDVVVRVLVGAVGILVGASVVRVVVCVVVPVAGAVGTCSPIGGTVGCRGVSCLNVKPICGRIVRFYSIR
jgi:hypothetical protein